MMSKTRVSIAAGCCLVAVALATWAQAARKAGLWEITTNMVWQQSPIPNGMAMPGGGPHSTQVCLTQAQVDKYGSPMPQNRGCDISNVAMKANGMTADWVCTAPMAGKGTVESSWTDPDHVKAKVHFLGAMQMGPNSKPVEYTIDVSSNYKGADCGSVKPLVTK
jgi:hypothetical protein